MLFVYIPRGNSLERQTVDEAGPIPEGAVWFDLVTPTLAEDKLVERALGIAVPTREEMQEIEVSSRLYIENGARYMTATLMCQSDTATPKTTPVTFILAGRKLVTVRYDEPRPFTLISNKLARTCSPTVSGETILMDLLDAVIDRAADILEKAGAEIDRISHDIFEPRRAPRRPQPHLPLHPQNHRPQRRPHLEGAREPGLDRPPRAVPRERSRRAEMAEGDARADQVDAARRRIRSPITRPIWRTRSRSCSTRCSA